MSKMNVYLVFVDNSNDEKPDEFITCCGGQQEADEAIIKHRDIMGYRVEMFIDVWEIDDVRD